MKKVIVGIFALTALAAAGFFFKSEPAEPDFPYGESSAEVKIRLDQNNIAVSQRSAFQIIAGDIEGQATLMPAPTAAAGEASADSQLYGVKSAFQERPAPYGGQITKSIACDSQKYVKEQVFPFAGRETKLILAVASGRRIYGSCSAEEIKYASVFWAAFDPKRMQAVTVKLFKPIANMDEIARSQQELMQVLRLVVYRP